MRILQYFLTFQNTEEDNALNLGITESQNSIKIPFKRDPSIVENNRGRSVVHKNLEDNYGAVISANHEALAQLLEQVLYSTGNML